MYIKNGSKMAKEFNKIKRFFVRDDISRTTAGKKETLTRNKITAQKRYLLDSMKKIYQVYLRGGVLIVHSHVFGHSML